MGLIAQTVRVLVEQLPYRFGARLPLHGPLGGIAVRLQGLGSLRPQQRLHQPGPALRVSA